LLTVNGVTLIHAFVINPQLARDGGTPSYPREAYSPLVTNGQNQGDKAENVRNWVEEKCE